MKTDVKTRCSLAVAAALAIASVSVTPAAIPDPVRIDSGLVAGAPASSDGVRVFKGIPFGAPPVGALRWREPQAVAKWDGVRKADTYGPVCMQPPGMGRPNVSVDLPDSPPRSEDCLYLNVWTAATSASERRPVMFWIFGGAYTEGAGSSKHNEGFALARKGVVVVTFNYRLGPFGFLSHPELTAESAHHASGNYAMMDALAALRWVQRNIAAFGGDPANVTIFGESAGASLSAGLVGSPLAKGLFAHAISESGAWMGLSMAPMRPLGQAEEAGVRGAMAIGAGSLAELRAKPTADIEKMRGAGMIADGWVVPEDLSLTFARGRQNGVDVLVGSNKDEGSFVARGPSAEQWTMRIRARWGNLADRALKIYPAGSDAEAAASSERAFRDEIAWHMRIYAERQAQIGRRAFVYFFTYEPPTTPGQRNLRATHTSELPYVFDNLEAQRVFPDDSSPEIASMSPRDRALADQLSSYWVNFAKTGDPNGGALPEWPRYRNRSTGQPMILGDPASRDRGPDAETLALYDALYAKQLAAIGATTNH